VLFPIIAYSASRIFPPIFFVAVSAAITSAFLGLWLSLRGELLRGLTRRAIIDCAWVALLIVGPTTLIFLGSAHTSSISTGLLLQCEMLTTFLIYGVIFQERHTLKQYAGAALVFLGTLLVLSNGAFSIKLGDALIVLAIFIFPFGNFFAKRVLEQISLYQVLFFRYVFSVPFLLVVSFCFEDTAGVAMALQWYWWLFAAYIIFIMLLSKVFWYAGLRRLPVSKAISIFAVYPAFSLLFAVLFLHEWPTVYQFLGFILSLVGVYRLIGASVSAEQKDLV